MTKEEAIQRLRYMEQETIAFCDQAKRISEENKKDLEALDIAIKALEQEPFEDAISRAECLDNYNGVETPVGYRKVIDAEVIKNMKSVRPKEKTGHWIKQDNKEKKMYGWYFCSECNAYIGSPINYCSEYGANMKGGEQ